MFGYDEVLEDVRFAFTDRFGGTSQAPYGELNLGSAVGDDAEAVTANFRLIAAEFGVRPEGVVRVSQVHGRDVSVVRPDDELPMQPMPIADGVVTTREDDRWTHPLEGRVGCIAATPAVHARVGELLRD